jgi:hypothetical protein
MLHGAGGVGESRGVAAGVVVNVGLRTKVGTAVPVGACVLLAVDVADGSRVLVAVGTAGVTVDVGV